MTEPTTERKRPVSLVVDHLTVATVQQRRQQVLHLVAADGRRTAETACSAGDLPALFLAAADRWRMRTSFEARSLAPTLCESTDILGYWPQSQSSRRPFVWPDRRVVLDWEPGALWSCWLSPKESSVCDRAPKQHAKARS